MDIRISSKQVAYAVVDTTWSRIVSLMKDGAARNYGRIS